MDSPLPIEELKRRAEQGDGQAMLLLGNRYDWGMNEARRGSEDDLLKVAIEIVEHYYSHWKDKEKRKIARREAYNIIVDMARWEL